MFLFLKLYLAHLIGDFVLQFEELYQLKVRRVAGHVWHVVMHILVSLLLIIPYLKIPFAWLFIMGLCVVHLGQDLIKYSLQGKYPQYRFLLFVADQICHALVLTSIFLFPISEKVLGYPGLPTWDLCYRSLPVTVGAIAFVLGTFGGSYLLHNFRLNFISGSRRDHYITNFEMIHAILERSVITGIFLFSSSPVLFLLAPGIGVLRFFSKKLQSKIDFVLSFLYAVVVGLAFRSVL